jgi:outer membrane murein-binding lipoprotein Lpp
MNNWIKFLAATLLASALLASCASPHPMDMAVAVQSAKSKADHEALAAHYEQTAQEMQAKVDEHKKLLAVYQAKPWVLGKQAQTFQGHCMSLIGIYQQAVDANLKMAAAHRQMEQGVP